MLRFRLGFGLLCVAILVTLTAWFWPRPRLNLLIVTLDTTRADRLGCYGYKNGSTPALDALAAAGIVFDRACTVAPETLPAHATLFTGLHPAEHGLLTNGKGRLGESIPTLAEILERQGYKTGAFVGSFVLDSKFGLRRGFKTYDDDLTGSGPQDGKGLERERKGQFVVDAALAWLKRLPSRPFCCWVHLYDAHFPYLAHEDQFGSRFVQEPYDGEIAYLDFQVGRLLEHLKSAQLERSTLVVVVADHGEGLGDHQERRHGSLLYNSTLHVPLIMRNPGRITPGQRVSTCVSLVDLFPTILDSLQVARRGQISGRSLTAAFTGNNISASPCYAATDVPFLEMGWAPLRSLITERWKYIRTTRSELYDLVADPGEMHDVAESQPEEMRRMDGLLVELESKMSQRETADVALSAKERRVLQSLGYGTGASVTPSGATTEIPADMKDMLVYWNAVDDAIQFREHGELEAAREKLEFVTQGAPSTSIAHVYLGNLYDATGKTAEAEAAYRTALKYNPELTLAHYYLGDHALRKGQVDEAAAEYSAALKSDPSMAEAHFKLGNILQQKGDVRAAQTHFEAAIQYDPYFPPAHINLGNLLLWQGRTVEAEHEYRAALKIAPDSTDAYSNLASILAASGRWREAEAELLHALRVRPNDAVLGESLKRVRAEIARGKP